MTISISFAKSEQQWTLRTAEPQCFSSQRQAELMHLAHIKKLSKMCNYSRSYYAYFLMFIHTIQIHQSGWQKMRK